MAFSTTKSALVIGLRSFGFFRLSCDFHFDSWVVDVLSIHIFNCFIDGIFSIKNLIGLISYDKGVISDHSDFFYVSIDTESRSKIFFWGVLRKASHINLWIAHI